MSQFIIEGGKTLSGTIPVYGSKNAALPLLAATLLTKEEVHLSNMPSIADVTHMVEILEGLGATVKKTDTNISVHADTITTTSVPEELVGKLRGSILLLGALLGRNRTVTLPKPGGDIIGARPIDTHLDAFRQLGAIVTEEDDTVSIDGSALAPGTVVLEEFSVTTTENVLMLAATIPGTTTIHIAAAEPHIVALATMLSSMGAKIEGAGTHTITVHGAEHLTGTSFENIQDMLEAGLFMLLGAATKSELTVRGVPHQDLLLFFKKLDDIGIAYEIAETKDGQSNVTVRPSELRAFSVQTLPHPGIATDLQAPFSVIATQVTGSTLIHDPMYEGRFKYAGELAKMGADVTECDPHRVIITGPTPLRGKQLPSLDIRAGATLIMAGLVASGITTIDDAEIVDRGYAQLTERLVALGADIRRT